MPYYRYFWWNGFFRRTISDRWNAVCFSSNVVQTTTTVHNVLMVFWLKWEMKMIINCIRRKKGVHICFWSIDMRWNNAAGQYRSRREKKNCLLSLLTIFAIGQLLKSTTELISILQAHLWTINRNCRIFFLFYWCEQETKDEVFFSFTFYNFSNSIKLEMKLPLNICNCELILSRKQIIYLISINLKYVDNLLLFLFLSHPI